MSLIDDLTAKIDVLSSNDKDWVTFIEDHVKLIKASSRIVKITDADRDRYRYKFDHFLREYHCPANIAWIAKRINDLCNYDNFVIRSTIMIPDAGQITSLYRKYRTSINLS